jgi:hypothetical protein
MIDPTPPAPPTTSSVPVDSGESRNRSNSVSHAVIDVNGRAAASAKLSELGRRATIRSSTACSSALLPCLVISPAYQTSSPTCKLLTPVPTASTVPAAS